MRHNKKSYHNKNNETIHSASGNFREERRDSSEYGSLSSFLDLEDSTGNEDLEEEYSDADYDTLMVEEPAHDADVDTSDSIEESERFLEEEIKKAKNSTNNDAPEDEIVDDFSFTPLNFDGKEEHASNASGTEDEPAEVSVSPVERIGKLQSLSDDMIQQNQDVDYALENSVAYESAEIDDLLSKLKDVTPEQLEEMPESIRSLFLAYYKENDIALALDVLAAGPKEDKKFEEVPKDLYDADFTESIIQSLVTDRVPSEFNEADLNRVEESKEYKVYEASTGNPANDKAELDYLATITEASNNNLVQLSEKDMIGKGPNVPIFYADSSILDAKQHSDGWFELYPYEVIINGVVQNWNNNMEVTIEKGSSVVINTGIHFSLPANCELIVKEITTNIEKLGLQFVTTKYKLRREETLKDIHLHLVAIDDAYISKGSPICLCKIFRKIAKSNE